VAWRVEAFDAFTVWESNRRPSADRKGDMVAWLAQCEREGPPAADDVDDKANLTTRGPNGETIRFRRFDTPGRDLFGHMFILEID